MTGHESITRPSCRASKIQKNKSAKRISVRRKLKLLEDKFRQQQRALEELQGKTRPVLPGILSCFTFLTAFHHYTIPSSCHLDGKTLNSLAARRYIVDDVVDLGVSYALHREEQLIPLPTLEWQRIRANHNLNHLRTEFQAILRRGKVMGIPICLNEHWFLAVVDETQIKIYDSFIEYSERYDLHMFARGAINAALTDRHRPLCVMYDSAQQQPDNNNCALYVLYRMMYWREIRDGEIREAQIRAYIEGVGREEMRAIIEREVEGRVEIPETREKIIEVPDDPPIDLTPVKESPEDSILVDDTPEPDSPDMFSILDEAVIIDETESLPSTSSDQSAKPVHQAARFPRAAHTKKLSPYIRLTVPSPPAAHTKKSLNPLAAPSPPAARPKKSSHHLAVPSPAQHQKKLEPTMWRRKARGTMVAVPAADTDNKTGRLRCPDCRAIKTFATTESYTVHHAQVHQNLKLYRCGAPGCNFRGRTAYWLNQHKLEKHSRARRSTSPSL